MLGCSYPRYKIGDAFTLISCMITYTKLPTVPLLMIGLSVLALWSCTDSSPNASAASVSATPQAAAESVADWAPRSVKGKTITFNYNNAKYRYGSDKEDGPEWYDDWDSEVEKVTDINSITFSTGNYNEVGKNESLRQFAYSKKTSTVAEIHITYVEAGDTYILIFTSPNGGVARCEVYSEGMWMEIVDITFTIK